MRHDRHFGTTAPGRPPQDGSTPTRFDRHAIITVLTLFAITWPVLDLLGRNAEFFLARRSPRVEILGLALLATLGIPLLVGFVGVLPGRTGSGLASGAIGVLSAALLFLYVRRIPISWWLALTVSVALGRVALWAFRRSGAVRAIGRCLLGAPVVMLGVFLFTMPVGDILRASAALRKPITVGRPAPIVIVVFDEFPLASIIDAEGRLRSRYPNFTRLASDGIWFRNAMTIEQQTEHSVPAILTGTPPSHSDIPVSGQYPFNLFTALRDSYELHVYESITELCPRELCEGLTISASSLAEDVGVVAGHVLLPAPLTEGLPPIDRAWGDFDLVANDFDATSEFRELLRFGPRMSIDHVLEDIRVSTHEGPELFYLHALIPHHPWQYLPDGRTYPYIVTHNPASVGGGWIDDEFLVAQSMQRHLLQTGYADHVLGEIVTALVDEGIYEDSLVIVVADHGISIRPGVERQREITEESIGEIAAVPLFVKPPGAQRGVIDDRRALTIDILPTIADVLEAELPGDVEGVSLTGPDPHREETTTAGPDSSVTYGISGAEKLDVAVRIEGLFPDGDPWALAPEGTSTLVGVDVVARGLETSGLTARIRQPALYADIDLSSAVIPARIGGVLFEGVDGDEVLAVAVNGTVAAVTRSYVDGGEAAFLAMVPPRYLIDGRNSIALYEIASDGTLRTVRMSSP